MQWMDFCGNKICVFLFFYFLKKSEIWHTDLSTQLGTSSTWQNVILKFINTFILYIKYDFCPSIIFFFFFSWRAGGEVNFHIRLWWVLLKLKLFFFFIYANAHIYTWSIMILLQWASFGAHSGSIQKSNPILLAYICELAHNLIMVKVILTVELKHPASSLLDFQAPRLPAMVFWLGSFLSHPYLL